MRIGSRSVLDVTRQMLGLDDFAPKLMEKCLEFEIGRALLVGPWAAGGAQIVYSAARRTIEGGRNLRDEFWARPVHSIATTALSSTTVKNRKPRTQTSKKRASKVSSRVVTKHK